MSLHVYKLILPFSDFMYYFQSRCSLFMPLGGLKGNGESLLGPVISRSGEDICIQRKIFLTLKIILGGIYILCRQLVTWSSILSEVLAMSVECRVQSYQTSFKTSVFFTQLLQLRWSHFRENLFAIVSWKQLPTGLKNCLISF